FEHHDGRIAVLSDVADLRSAEGVVDRAGQCPQMGGREVDDPMLGALGHHDEHSVAFVEADGPKSLRERSYFVAQLLPAQSCCGRADPTGECWFVRMFL